MDHAAVLALYDREMRGGARPDGPGARIERAGGVVRQIADASGWNGVLWSGLDAAGADRAIREQIARFTGLERDFEWKLYAHDEPADLAARLLAAGFRAEPAETLMVAEVAGLALDTAPPAGVRLVRATGPAGVDLVVDVHERAFGTDGTALRHRLLARLAADPGAVVAVAAVADGEPVAAARMELVPGAPFAGLWGGGTVGSLAGPGPLPGAGRPPRPGRRRAGLPPPPGRRPADEPPDPSAPRLPPAERHDPVRVRGADSAAGKAPVQRHHPEGRQRDLDEPLDPVGSIGVRDPEPGGDRRAQQRGHDADGDRPQDADALPPGDDQPSQDTDDDADDDGAENA